MTTEEEGFEGAWFAATIVEVKGSTLWFVQFLTLRNEDDTEFLGDEIHVWQIRPSTKYHCRWFFQVDGRS
ncbi:Protein AGENET DOMAIN (AGD)-CONTAINING P1 [Linum perenne]